MRFIKGLQVLAVIYFAENEV